MASLMAMLRGKGRAAAAAASVAERGPPGWAEALFPAPLVPLVVSGEGAPRVWALEGPQSGAAITDQFTTNAAEYHRRYAASDHFEALFRQAVAATGLAVGPEPLVLDLGSGSGVNSIVPCRRLFPGARFVATDLSAELLAMLAAYAEAEGLARQVVCVRMDAMSPATAAGAFDLVTGASILHHLDKPMAGVKAAARALKPGGQAIFFEPFNGWALMRLAFERILAEAGLRGASLEPAAEAALRQLVKDVAERSTEDYATAVACGDDKWLFSRTGIAAMARQAGFADARFVPHNDHASLYRDTAAVHLRLSSGRDDLSLPDWALAVLDGFDSAMTLNAKRELMLEGSIVLTKAA